ncbi:MAG: hypothetical protein QM710_12255 [Flavobacterium sp.]
MEIFFILLVAFFLILAGLAYLSMKFFKRFTANSKYRILLNVLVFTLSFAILFAITVFIIDNTVTIER